MNTVLAWLVIGMALVGVASGAVLIATVMRELFNHRHRHA